MKHQTVIIRYNEDISWSKYLTQPAIIYNKGVDIETNHQVVNLKNVGMYMASQLYHCIHNYDNLADYTFFIQGNPWDGLLESAHGLTGTQDDVLRMENLYYYIPNNEHASANYLFFTIGDRYEQPINWNQRHHDHFITYTHTWNEWTKIIDCNSLIDWNQPSRLYKNGHITLSKEAIRSNPKSWYLKILDYLKYDVPCIEWYAESSHNIIFNVDHDGLLQSFGHKAPDYENKTLDYNFWLR